MRLGKIKKFENTMSIRLRENRHFHSMLVGGNGAKLHTYRVIYHNAIKQRTEKLNAQ